MTHGEEGGRDGSIPWYWPAWAADAPLPRFSVWDTESSHGRYASRTKTIEFTDLVKFHGHACDGLFRGGIALAQALPRLYPDGRIDRTATRVLSKNSPCLGDVAAYLTGGRVRFGSQDVRDDPGVWFIVQRLDNGRTVSVREAAGFYPAELTALESRLVSEGAAAPETLDRLQQAQWAWVRDVLLPSDWAAVYPCTEETAFTWTEVPYGHLGIRTDVLFKGVPRSAP